MIYTIDLSSGKVNRYKDLVEANAKEGYVHEGDTYPTRLAALEAIRECTIEDLRHNEDQKREAERWIATDKRILKKVAEEIKMELKLEEGEVLKGKRKRK